MAISIRKASQLILKTHKADPSLTFALIGEPGIGKTAVGYQIAAELNREVVIVNPGNMSLDTLGIPYRSASDELLLEWAMDTWMRKLVTQDSGVFIGDELNHGAPEILNIFYTVFESLRREIRGHKIGANWLIMATMNPPNGIHHVRELTPSLMDRFIKFDIKVDAGEFLEYAKEKGFAPIVKEFLSVHEELIMVEPQAEKQTPNPRNWDVVSKLFLKGAITEDSVDEDAQLLVSKLGGEAAATFMSYIREAHDRYVKASDIFGKPGWKAVASKFFDQQKAGKNDKITASVKDIAEYAVDHYKKAATIVPVLSEILLDTRLSDPNRTLLITSICPKEPSGESKNAADAYTALFVKDKSLIALLTKAMSVAIGGKTK
jgi:hypothetical protein